MKIFSIILWGLMMITTSSSLAVELKIKVTDIDVKRGGNIMVMIFGEDGFPKKHDKALFLQTLTAHQEVMYFIFNIETEELAIKVLHDEDMNGKTTKNWTGIWPKEGLGFSNDQKVSMKGAPNYKYSKLSRELFKNGLSISVVYP